MENIIYRIDMGDKYKLEFYICITNEVEPYRETREMAVQLIIEEVQLDGCLDEAQLESLIKFLQECQLYLTKYNTVGK